MANEGQSSGGKKERVLVIGAGVIGLTTALTLAKHGCRVTILSREFVSCENKSKLTSQVAAAFWTINTGPGCEEKLINWCLDSYEKFTKIAKDPQGTGVFIRELVYAYPHKIDDNLKARNMKRNFEKHLPGNPIRHGKHLLIEKGLSVESGLVDAMSIHLPLIETDMYMYWLTQRCISNGIDFIQGTVHSLLENCDSLRRIHRVDFIVNCTGLDARKVVQDKNVYPMLGVSLVLHNDDRTFNLPPNCAIRGKEWEEDGSTAGEIAIVPRGEHSLWLGTMVLESYDKSIGLEHPRVQRMLQECQTAYPPLRTINQDDLHVTVGIRPMRTGGPRVERDARHSFLIHNYGHGKVGVMLSWGCAEEVFHILKKSTCAKL